jgi:hypothetical protein
MEHENHEKLNLIYYAGADQPHIQYTLNIPETTPDTQSKNFSIISNFTTSLYNTHSNVVGEIISNATSTSISITQFIEVFTYIISLPLGTITFGFNIIGNNNQSYFTGGQVINLNFMYGSGEYQNANVKYATLLPVNDQNQARLLTVEFNN